MGENNKWCGEKSKLNFTSFFCNWLLQGQGHLCLVIAIWATVMIRRVEWKKNNELDSYWTTEEGLPCQQWFSDMGTEISLDLILPVKIPYPQACPLRPFGYKSNATGDVEVLNWLARKDTVHFRKLLVIELQCNLYFSQASVLSSNIQWLFWDDFNHKGLFQFSLTATQKKNLKRSQKRQEKREAEE